MRYLDPISEQRMPQGQIFYFPFIKRADQLLELAEFDEQELQSAGVQLDYSRDASLVTRRGGHVPCWHRIH
jgi:hypothetical protein